MTSAVASNLFISVLCLLTGYPFAASRQICDRDADFVVFKSLFYGCLIYLVVMTSYYTSFLTINLSIPVLFAYPLYHGIRSEGFSLQLFSLRNFPVRQSLLLLLVVLLLTLFQLFRYDYFDKQYVLYGFSDYSFYSYQGQKIRDTGSEAGANEANLLGIDPDASRYRMPSHYFDMELIPMLQSVNRDSNIRVYLFSFMPLAGAFIFQGFLSLIAFLRPRLTPIDYFAAASGVFYFGVLPLKKGAFFTNLLIIPKTFCAYLICLAAIGYLLRRNYLMGSVCLVLMPIFNLLAAPQVFSGTFLFGLYLFLARRERKEGTLAMLFPVLACFLIVAFYAEFGNFFKVAVSHKIALGPYLKNALRVVFRDTLFRMWFFYLPLVLVVVVNFGKIRKRLEPHLEAYLFFAGIALLAVIFAGLANFNIEADTMQYFPAHAIVAIFAVTVFSILVPELKQHGVWTGGTCLLLGLQFLYCIVFTYGFNYRECRVARKFIDEIEALQIPRETMVPIAVVRNEENFARNKWLYHPFVYESAEHFVFWPNIRPLLVALTVPVDLTGLEKKTHIPPSYIEGSPFYQYARGMKGVRDVEEIQVSFLKRFRFRYLVVERGARLGSRISALVGREIVDPVSGARFMALK